MVWIPALVAIVVLAAWWVRRRDMSLPDGTILAGFAAAYVPWLALTQHRSFVFIFYLLPAVPFLVPGAGPGGAAARPRTAVGDRGSPG